MSSCAKKSVSSASKKSSHDFIGMLNEQQKELVVQNHNLIYGALHTFGYPVSEFYDVSAIGLCKAAMLYDDTIEAKFSTVAYKCILNSCRTAERYLYRHNADYKALSLEEEIVMYFNKSDKTHFRYLSQSFYSGVCEDEEELFIISFCSVVDDMVKDCGDVKCRKYFKLHKCGLNDTDIARQMGLERHQVLYIKEKLIKFLREKLKI